MTKAPSGGAVPLRTAGYREQVLRLALTPRWLGLLAVALLLASGFAWLGSWQLQRSRQNATPVVIQSAKPLQQVLAPQQALPSAAGDTPVIVRGTLDVSQAVVVDGRRAAGRPVSWLVAPVLVQIADGTARLPVVIGSFEAFSTVSTHSASVEFTAMLQPSEEPSPATADGDTGSVSSADLINRWGGPIYAGFVFADRATLQQVSDTGLTVIDPPKQETSRGFALLNLSYAVQWWIFAVIACFLWWRLLRDNYNDRQAENTVPEISTSKESLTP